MELERTAQMRVYPLDPQSLTQEQIAVTFAMTSRNPAAFDEIREAVTESKAADFHERWVLNYGHASVAEHAVLHMAVENISRLACDELEDNRLASYTEKSSRYQVLDRGSYHLPAELRGHPLEQSYTDTCDYLFDVYHDLVPKTIDCLKTGNPQREGERESAYNLRLRRIATDHCRFVLPAATLTNVGVTINARALEHAITKLLSSELAESRELGERLKAEGQAITPTLIKYADRSQYLVETRREQIGLEKGAGEGAGAAAHVSARLAHFDPQAEEKLVAALLFRFSSRGYDEVWRHVQGMGDPERERVVDMALRSLGSHDPPIRELEVVDYTFDLEMDYGAYREYKRHRMQSYIPQPLVVGLGYIVPYLVAEAGVEKQFREAMEAAQELYGRLSALSPEVAQYAATHAHKRRVLAKLNLRECYHLFKLRTAPEAHFTIQEVAKQALALVQGVHPLLVKYIRLRGAQA